MNFPHLQDTRFPNFDNVNVYSFRNEFDYTRWDENTLVHLVNVIWNSDYKDVVKFETNEDRDAWFSLIEDNFPIQMVQKASVVPDGFIKLPVPYDVAAKYNYMYVDIPVMTSPDNMIDYERTDGIRRWYFFINEISYRAPNTTEFRITPDVWTNFQNDVEINYMLLERGHAPVAVTDTDEYLNNPVANSSFLLAPDYDFDGNTIVRHTHLYHHSAGEKWLCMASTCAPNQIEQIGYGVYVGNDWTEATYYNGTLRFDWQVGIRDYNWGIGYDYSNTNVPVNNESNDIVPCPTVYCIRASECYGNGTFLSDLRTSCPAFIKTLQAAFLVDDSMVTLGNAHEIAGHRIYECKSSYEEPFEIKLTKEMFNFPKEFERFAKLYTFPYSYVQLTDNEGRTVDVHVEDTSKISAQRITVLTFPFLKMRFLFNGIGGDAKTSYWWFDVTDTRHELEMQGDWRNYSFDWDIPTYALFIDGATEYALTQGASSFNSARRNAITTYQTIARQANNACENAKDLATTAELNVNQNATTLLANTANNCNMRTANNTLTTTTNTSMKDTNNGYNTALTVLRNTNESLNRSTRKDMNNITTNDRANTSIAAATNTEDATIRAGTLTSGLAAVGMGLAVPTMGASMVVTGGAALIGTAAVIAESKAQKQNTINAMNVEKALADVVNDGDKILTGRTTGLNSAMNDASVNLANSLNTLQNDCLTGQVANINTCETNNATNTANGMNANAVRTRATTHNNANWTRVSEIDPAKDAMSNAMHNARDRYSDASRNLPTQITKASGNIAQDAFMQRGVQMKVRTQSDSAIWQTASMFARYGYALNQMWRVDKLQVMNHFTYWKAKEIWVDDRASSNNAVNRAIETMFLNGVTVWSDPEEIGRIDVYAN